MLKNKNAESLTGIMVWVVLIVFVLFGFYNLILYVVNYDSNSEEKSSINLLKSNLNNIIYKLDFAWVNQWEKFYVYKNNDLKKIQILTWSENEKYKYVDSLWNYIDPNIFLWTVYERTGKIEKKDFPSEINIFSLEVKKLNKN